MALKSQVVQIPILGGINEEIDERVLPVGVLTTAKNVTWNKKGAVDKRPGFTILSSSGGYSALASTGEDPTTGKELCAISPDGTFYGWSNSWLERGRVSPCSVAQTGVWTDTIDWAAGDLCESGESLTSDYEEVYVIHSSCGSYHTNSPSSETTRRLGVWAEIRDRKDEVILKRQLLAEGTALPTGTHAASAPRNFATTGKLCTAFLRIDDAPGGATNDNLYVYDWIFGADTHVKAYDVTAKFGYEVYTVRDNPLLKGFNIRTFDAIRVDSGSHVGNYVLAFIDATTREVIVVMMDPGHGVIHSDVLVPPRGGSYSRVALSWDTTNNLLSLVARHDEATGQQNLYAWAYNGETLVQNWGPVRLDQTIKWNNNWLEVIENIGSCQGPLYPTGSSQRHVYLWGRYAGEPGQQGPVVGTTDEWHIGWVSCCTSLDATIVPSDVPLWGFEGAPARTRNSIPKSKPFIGRNGCYMVIGSCYHQEQTGVGCARSDIVTGGDASGDLLDWIKIDSTAVPPITEASCTRRYGSWTDDGFKVSMRVIFSHAPHNNGTYTIKSVSHKTMVFNEDITLDVTEASVGTTVTGEDASGNQENPGEDRVYLFEHTSLFEWRAWDYTDVGGLHRLAATRLEFCGCWDIGLGNGIENSTRIYAKNDTMRIGSLQTVARSLDIPKTDYQNNSFRFADVRRSDTVNSNERETDTDAADGSATLTEINYGQQHRFITTQCVFNFDAVSYIERTHRNLMLIGGATINCYDGLRIGDLGFAAPPVISNWVGVSHAYWDEFPPAPAPPPAFPPYPHLGYHGIWIGGTKGVRPYTGYHYVTMWMSIDNRGHLHRSMPSNQIDYTWVGNPPAYDDLFVGINKYDSCDEDQNLAIITLNAHALGSTNRARYPYEEDAGGFPINTPDGYASCYWFRSAETGISHRIGDPSSIRNNHVWQLYGTDDLLIPGYADNGEVLEGPQLYTDGGEIEAVKPESSRFIVVANERVWIAGQATPERIQYSKKYGISAGGLCIAPEFNEGFAVGIPSGKACTGLARLDDKVIVFSSSEVYAIAGAGPLDDGSQNDLSQLTLVTDNFGCVSPNSVVTTPVGVMFHSKAGLCRLNRDLSVTMLHEVEDTLDTYDRVMSACIWPEKEVVVFAVCNQMVTTGVLLVYNYDKDAWAIWEILGDPRGGSLPVVPIAVTNWDGELVVSTDSDGTFISYDGYRDHSTSWYTSSLSTAWLQAATQGAWQRVRGVIVQSEPESASYRAGMTVKIYNDFQTTASQTCTWTSADLAALPEPSRQDLFVKPIRQKCAAIKIEASDVEPAASGRPDNKFSICGFALDLGVKPTLTRVDAKRRQ